eukprot:jgi/Chrpa1/21627/Chrysochromulina_OHIO_Genome00024298-RA
MASAENEGCCSGSGGNVELAGCCGASTTSSGTKAGSEFDAAASAISMRRPMSTGLVPSVVKPSLRSFQRSS